MVLFQKFSGHQVVIAQCLAQQLATLKVSGPNPGKGENLITFWLKKKLN